MANRFVGKSQLKQVDLGDGDWVKISEKISYEIVAEMTDENLTNGERATISLIRLIKEWNLKDAEGQIVPVTKKNILMLDIETVTKIMTTIGTLLEGLDPKESTVSN